MLSACLPHHRAVTLGLSKIVPPAEHMSVSPDLETFLWRLVYQELQVVSGSCPGTVALFPPSSGSVMEEWGVSGAAGYLGISSVQLWVQGSCSQRVDSGVDGANGSAPCNKQTLLSGQYFSGLGTRACGHGASGDRGALLFGSAKSSCWTNHFHTPMVCPPSLKKSYFLVRRVSAEAAFQLSP